MSFQGQLKKSLKIFKANDIENTLLISVKASTEAVSAFYPKCIQSTPIKFNTSNLNALNTYLCIYARINTLFLNNIVCFHGIHF